jgi:dCMP deaminase
VNWDVRFLRLAREISSWSKDPSTKTGAVIVRPDKTVASLGFNGFPKGMYDSPIWLNDREEKYSRIVHCEMNAVILAKEPLVGYTLYTWPFASCDRCAVHMIQAGIQRFVFPSIPEDKKERWEKSLAKTIGYFTECNLQWKQIDNID